jgi:hypothetical protein
MLKKIAALVAAILLLLILAGGISAEEQSYGGVVPSGETAVLSLPSWEFTLTKYSEGAYDVCVSDAGVGSCLRRQGENSWESFPWDSGKILAHTAPVVWDISATSGEVVEATSTPAASPVATPVATPSPVPTPVEDWSETMKVKYYFPGIQKGGESS